MAEDMGTWPPEQATVLLEVLSEAGLHPEAKRTRDGVQVTVPDQESEEAHRQLVANMDRIASAAQRPKGPQRSARRARPVKGADNQDPDERRMPTERLQQAARPIGLILIGLLLVATVGRFNLPIAIALLAALVYFIGKRAQQEGDDGPSGGGSSGRR